MKIRKERQGEAAEIAGIHRAAFGGESEAHIVNDLRKCAGLTLSLAAEIEGVLIGHIAFSQAKIGAAVGAALAPLAVLPAYQRRGAGGALVREGLKRIGEMGFSVCVVLGHSEYYPRFGFVPADRYDIHNNFNASPQNFFAAALQPGALEKISGIVQYHSAFYNQSKTRQESK